MKQQYSEISQDDRHSFAKLKIICDEKKYKIMILIILCYIIYCNEHYGKLQSYGLNCIKDPIHDLTVPILDYLKQNPKILWIYPLIANFLLDLYFIMTSLYWLKNEKITWYICTLAFFYAVRALNQPLIQLPLYHGYYNENTNFPSFLTHYGLDTDFYFSGHSGFSVIHYYFWNFSNSKYKNNMMRFILLSMLLNISQMIIYRVHYTVGIQIQKKMLQLDYYMDNILHI